MKFNPALQTHLYGVRQGIRNLFLTLEESVAWQNDPISGADMMELSTFRSLALYSFPDQLTGG